MGSGEAPVIREDSPILSKKPNWLLILLGLWVMASLRLLPLIFLYALSRAYTRKQPTQKWLLPLLWSLFWGVFFLFRIEVSLRNHPGPPHLVSYAFGYPNRETRLKIKTKEVIWGGCVVNGPPPRYLLVW